ncbi:uncharacterized protein I303_102677 [Kwoniella dejecticola CBS 10117]|uniref:START domain-containing protein n=1 Tax=Kwoniella dejecticola CBS 10117 TaxID=1296121 RepID=A0A1A6A9F1_9TREE|nr:uncharacterized protein I303_02693 [Kwoniella dejecticola CBS 10117]OBR86681.1 hypothetical protein I303_02693 [Kwoniella dejecticola CBS 10117]
MRLENLDDGSKLEAAWHESLSASLTYFRALLSSSSSSAWKPVSVLPLTASTTANDSGKSAAHGSTLGRIDASQVTVHRRNGKAGEVYRAVVEVDCGSDVSIDTFRGCLVTPETRPMWDRMVEEAVTLDLLDAHTRVTRTNYRLGWPSSPRDAVTISKTLVDQHTLIDITTSLPRSKHEPAYLRPAPPHVRAHVTLLAWCIQLPSNTFSDTVPEGKARITCFWSWNPKGAWAVGGGVPQHLPSLVVGLVDYIRDGSEKVPVLLGYGPDVAIGSVHYDTSRVTLSVGYAIVASGGENRDTESLRRQVEFGISSTQSWDVQVSVKTQHGNDSHSASWSSFVGQAPSSIDTAAAPKRLILRFAHARLDPGEELVRVKVSIERTTSSTAGVRINGIPVGVEPMQTPIPRRPLLEDTASMTGISLRTIATAESYRSEEGSLQMRRTVSQRNDAAHKSIASLIRRNYIYFTSLLQEPEQKWRPVLDSRGVAIHQLNSIDKTLIVFRAEAVFVGVGIWDLFAVIASPGARLVWDKSHEDAALLEDVNELTDLWHIKSKAAWPVSARDSVMLRTTYKSPSSVHLFGFSTDDTDLFPRIPAVTDPNVIRTQIDLQGWSVESLSPNTTQVTLLEQSDPRGWSNKSSIPQVMMSTLAGIGEFAIKHGAPPVATRLGGARVLSSRYDVEQETFKFEYEAAEARRSNSSSTHTSFPLPVAVKNPDAENGGSEASSLRSMNVTRPLSNIECEIRCDADQWSNSFAILIDPPQQAISALRRHRLSPSGGGLWLTIEHDPNILKNDKVAITVRRGTAPPGKTSVTVNGSKVKIDLEDLPDGEVQLLKKQKRGRPTRAPLDQPPALGTLRKKRSNLDLGTISAAASPDLDKSPASSSTSAFTKYAMPLTKWYSVAAETTKAAIIPMTSATPAPESGSTPVDAAVKALGQLAKMHSDRDGESTDPNSWQPLSDRDGLKIEKRNVVHVSGSFPVFRAGRIIEGFTAEDVSATVSSLRKDERFDKPTPLQSFGNGITTSHMVAHTTFPFRGRSMLVATIVARMPDPPPPSPSAHGPHTPLSTILHASTSNFDANALNMNWTKYNPTALPQGNVILEGWILETIDPYSHEQYAIPSTRCMYVASLDYSGSMPLSVNNMLNASLPRALLAIEYQLKSSGPPSRARSPPMSVLAPDERSSAPWGLEGLEADRAGVHQKIEEEQYSLTVTVQPSRPSSRDREREGGTLSPVLKHNDSRSSVNTGRSTVIDLAEEIRKGRRDLLVLEVEMGNSPVKSGCQIDLKAVSLPVASHNPSSEGAALPLNLPEEYLDLPFRCSIISLAPNVLQSASLDPATQSKHLLRVTLPTTGYDAPISDPLGGTAAPTPRPRWLLDLTNDGAVIQLTLKPHAPGEASKKGYWYGLNEVLVEDERRSKTFGLRDSTKSNLPQLVNRATQGSTALDKPLAVAREFLKDEVKKVEVDYGLEAGDSVAGDGATTPLEEGRGSAADLKFPQNVEPSPSTTTIPESTSRYSYNFWRYSRLPRFSNSAPATAEHSPIKTTTPRLPNPTSPSSDIIEKDRSQSEDPVPNRFDKEKNPQASGITTPSSLMDKKEMMKPVVSLPGLIIACMICLLLGSLLRSLLSEADFVIYQSTPPGSPNEGEHWRELKRLAEWKIGWNRDLIVAIARRG